MTLFDSLQNLYAYLHRFILRQLSHRPSLVYVVQMSAQGNSCAILLHYVELWISVNHIVKPWHSVHLSKASKWTDFSEDAPFTSFELSLTFWVDFDSNKQSRRSVDSRCHLSECTSTQMGFKAIIKNLGDARNDTFHPLWVVTDKAVVWNRVNRRFRNFFTLADD